ARTLAVASPEMFLASAAAPRVEQDEATIVQVTERVIAEAAAHGRIVLVGRGAQAVLARRPDALHVYVVASKPWRMQLAVERLGVDPARAEQVVDETDRQRDQYVRTYYGRPRHPATPTARAAAAPPSATAAGVPIRSASVPTSSDPSGASPTNTNE